MQMPHKFRAYVSGYRGGKTWVGSVARVDHFLRNPGVNQGYFAPTYPQIRDIFYPTIQKVCHAMGVTCEIREANKEVHFYNGGTYIGTIICRSMEKPSTIIGFEIGDALVDEIDTMPINKATEAWGRIIARMSYVGDGIRNGVDVTTTPEGFKFVYNKFKHAPTDSYGLVQASTYDNEKNIPDDYIPSLLETYPSELIEAYLNGQFVNLTSGSVYYAFDREQCNTHYLQRPRETLHIGMDFNVMNMSAVVHILRDGCLSAVDEVVGLRDTPDMVLELKQRYPGHSIIIYPDASGKARSSKGSSLSDHSILKDAGFRVRAKNANPLVRDRVLSLNIGLEKGTYKVNIEKCPILAECLEQQAYDKNGAPDKTSGFDHLNDAAGYARYYLMPVIKHSVINNAMGGF